jgi:hypothetical protein
MAKDKHLHIRWGKEDEAAIKKVMDHYNIPKSEAIRYSVHRTADQIRIVGQPVVQPSD